MPEAHRDGTQWLSVALWQMVCGTVDLGLGASLGMYYTVTYFGRVLIPLYGVVALGAPLQYYLSVGEIQDTTVQAWLWMACFPLVGAAWRLCVYAAARLAGEPATYAHVVRLMWWTGVPLILPLPFAAYALGVTEAGFSLEALLAACLRRQFAGDPGWFLVVYWVAAVLAMLGEAWTVWVLIRHLRPGRRVLVAIGALTALLLFIVATGALLQVCCGAGRLGT